MIRELALELLDDEHGISQDAWTALYKVLEQSGEEYEDIAAAVDGSEGRVYLPEDHDLR